jgi:phenylacetate-CoA ligase
VSAYSLLLERVMLPAYNAALGRKYSRLRGFLERSQWWTPERIVEFQWKELQALLRHTFETVPYYRRKHAGVSADDIRTLEDYARLAPLTREEVNEHRAELCSAAFRGRLHAHATGGSSGTPTRFFITRESFDWRTACTQRCYAWPGCLLGERTLYLWGAPIGRQTKRAEWKMKAFRAIRREFMVNTFHQNAELWERVLKYGREVKAPFVVGYVSSLEGFCRFLLETRQRLEGVRAVIAAAEPVHAGHRELVRDALGAPLYNTYGSREFMSIGGECERHDGLHTHAENLLVETAQAPEQGPSKILITDLHNFGMPFLRYEIGDLGVLETAPCGCGRGLPRLRSIEGRVLDALRGRDGRVVPGEFFPHLMKDIAEVREFQVEQKALDRIVVRAVLNQELGARSRATLESEVRKAFGDSARVEVERVDAIPPRPSGKRRVTIGLGQ